MIGDLVKGTLSSLEEVVAKMESEDNQVEVKGKGKGKAGFAPGGGLPALPGALVERIRAGNYVDFTDLLPENIAKQFKDEKDKKKSLSLWNRLWIGHFLLSLQRQLCLTNQGEQWICSLTLG